MTIGAVKPRLSAIVAPWCRRSWKWKSLSPAARAARRNTRPTSRPPLQRAALRNVGALCRLATEVVPQGLVRHLQRSGAGMIGRLARTRRYTDEDDSAC